MAKTNPKPKQKQKAIHNLPGQKKVVPKSQPKNAWQLWGFGIALLIITCLVFSHTTALQFVNWDDPDNILDNPHLKIFSYSWDWSAVKTIFTTDVIGNYNPLPILTFAMEQHWFAPDPTKAPFIFHFDNLWMHLVCTLFVFAMFSKMGFSKSAAFIGALLFGIHPLRVESVAWITERKDVLYGMFFLAALVAYISYIQSQKSKVYWYVFAILLSLFSYFAKVQAVTLPLSMVALDFYFKRKWFSPKILIVEKLPWWILSLTFGLINIHFLGQQKSLNFGNASINYTFIDRLAVGAYAYATYLVKWLVPFKMSPLYPYPPKLPVIAFVCLAIVPVLVIAFLIWAYRKKKNDLLFGWAFFTFNVMFLLQIVGAGQGYLADRFTYIGYIGLFFILIKGYDWLVENKPSYKTFAPVGAALYLAVFAFLTMKQIKVWDNSGTLWEHVKSYYPDSPLAWKQAGNYYRDDKKDFAKSIENYKEAIRLEPKDAYVNNSLAKSYMDKAFSLDPKSPGFANQQQSLVQLAIQSYNAAITRDSIDGAPNKKQTGEYFVNRGVAHAVTGNTDQAIVDLTKGLDIYPANANGYLNRGLIYFQKDEFALSLKDHETYNKLDPYNPDMW
ncbi:MAG: Peptidase c14 caspase catalytic subunit p20 [Bacteroidota bacterium]|nr:Peptidase c14 caspase catalytic subunit p20 [Bacteroidota bacterium]